MLKQRGKKTLAEKISGILSTTPTSYDPEDDADNQTSAKLLNESFDEDDGNEEELLSQFRKKNVDLLADVDEKYAGIRGSRKSLNEDSDGDSEEPSVKDDSSDEDNVEEEEENDSNEENDSENESEIDLEEANFSHFKDTDATQQIKKGQCVRNQMNMWENLLEMRIQVQKSLIASNKMPQTDFYNEIKKDSGAIFTEKIAETKTNLCNVLDKLLQFQKLLLKKYPETKNLDETKKTDNDDENEEIPSDTDEELDKEESEEEQEEKPQKRRKLNDYEKQISETHNKYKNYRNSVIEKWNEKTRIIVANKNSQNHSVLNQIEHNLSDKLRLIKRTQLKRSDYKIIGQQNLTIEKQANEDNIEIKPIEEYNTNIYDDNDFYHQLLRELIEVKSADITDPVQLGRQWIQLQNLRSKMKRKIDTKATKGRKIRYAVHSKLVNFMAPIDENLWTDEAKTELYNSLFGKKL